MQPNFTPSPQPSNDPYAFMNQPRRTTSLADNLSSLTGRSKLILAAAALVILLILIFAAKSVFGGNKNVDLNSLYAVLGQEQELINLALSGSQQQQVMSQSYLNFTYTAMASAETDQMKLIKLLSYNGIRISPSSYILQPSADSQLKSAAQTSTFDSVYSSVMSQQLKQYQQDLSAAYSLNKSQVLKNYLVTDYKDTSALLTMLGSSYG